MNYLFNKEFEIQNREINYDFPEDNMFKKVLDDKGQEQTIPIELAAPEDAQLLYLEWRRNNIDR